MRILLGNQSVRFSRVEFCLITGLKFGVIPGTNQYLARENGIHQRYFGGVPMVKIEALKVIVRIGDFQEQFDGVKLCLLLILNAFLNGVDERGDVPIWHLRLVEDLDAFDLFPFIYAYSIYGFMNIFYGRTVQFEHRQNLKGKKKHPKEKYNLYGFAYSLLIFAFNEIPELALQLSTRSNNEPSPRILKWEFSKRPRKHIVDPIIKDKMYTLNQIDPMDDELCRWYSKGIAAVQDYTQLMDVHYGICLRCQMMAVIALLNPVGQQLRGDGHPYRWVPVVLPRANGLA